MPPRLTPSATILMDNPKKPKRSHHAKLPSGKTKPRRLRPTSGGCPGGDLLNEREAAFVRHYLADPERIASAAAIKAGYSARSAWQRGSDLLARPLIRDEIRRRTLPTIRKLEITADRVLQGLAELAFSNMLDFVDIDEITGQATIDLRKIDRVSAGAISEIRTEEYSRGTGDDRESGVRTKIKLANRHPSLVTLAQHLKIIGEDASDGNVRTVRFIIEGAPPALVDQYARHSEPLNITPARETQP